MVPNHQADGETMVNSMANMVFVTLMVVPNNVVTQGSFTMGNFMGLKQPEIIDGNHENLEV